jgi:hypothetical protein
MALLPVRNKPIYFSKKKAVLKTGSNEHLIAFFLQKEAQNKNNEF